MRDVNHTRLIMCDELDLENIDKGIQTQTQYLLTPLNRSPQEEKNILTTC